MDTRSSLNTYLLLKINGEEPRESNNASTSQFELEERENDFQETSRARQVSCDDDQECPSEISRDKKVDFILVHSGKDENENRKIYEANLEYRGLKLVREYNTESDLHFVKVHAPLDKVLYQKAEDMNIQMPMKKVHGAAILENNSSKNFFEHLYEKYLQNWDPLTVKEPTVRKNPVRTKTTFTKTNVEAFESKNGEYFFENAERSRMVHRILQLTSFSKDERETNDDSEEDEEANSREGGHGIEQLCHDGVYEAYYPMHDGPLLSCDGNVDNDRQRLQHDWASFSRMFKYQPLDAIRDYCGVRVSFYFAWLGVYTSFLVPAAVVGVLCFLYALFTMDGSVPLQEICDKRNEKLFYMCPQCDRHCSYYSLTSNCHYSRVAHLFDNGATVFFSVFMSIWATLFLEYWKRTEATLAFKWDVYNLLKEYEPLRPRFVVKVKETKENPVTKKAEPYIPTIIRVRRALGALAVVCFMILIVIGTLVGIVVYRASVLAALYAHSRQDLRENAKLVTSFTAASINLVFIQLLTSLYVKIAVFLTNWENPRTVSEFHNSFTLKMYVFEFVNTYSSLFYVAFFQTSLMNGNPVKYNRISGRRIEECHPSGCLIDVCIQLAVIMIGKQALGLLVEFVYPCFRKRWSDWRYRSNCSYAILPQWEADYLLNQEPEFRMFYEYLDMVIQFGFVTMFVASFPLAPLFALLNNFIEMRADAINFVINYRRRVAEQVRNIGIWFKILEILTKVSVLVNSFVIAFTTDFIPRLVYYYGYSPDQSLRGYVNNSLTYINISDLEQRRLPDNPYRNLNYTLPYCRFKDYVEPHKPYGVSKQFLYVMLFRVVFVIVFQYFVFFIKDILSWLVPDVPSSVEAKIRRKMHVARMCFRKSAVEATRESSVRERRRQTSCSTSDNQDGEISQSQPKNGNSPRIKKENETTKQQYIKPSIYFHNKSYV